MRSEVVCFLTRTPSQILLDVAADLAKCAPAGLKVAIMCDNEIDQGLSERCPAGVELLHMPAKEAWDLGYHSASGFSPPTCQAWDKAICKYARGDAHDFVWFIEDDVFIASAQVLVSIIEDSHNEGAEYVSNENFGHGHTSPWHWHVLEKQQVKKPWHGGLAVMVGVGRTLLNEIRDYARDKGTLIYIEMMFNTLAMHKGLRMYHPPEMKDLTWNGAGQTPEAGKLFHPLKDVVVYRKLYRFAE